MSRPTDHTGKVFGRLKAIKRVGSTPKGRAIWLCECSCGNMKEIDSANLITGNTKSCGCLKRKCTTRHME